VDWDFGFLVRYTPLFIDGILITIAYTIGTIFLGLLLGLVIGIGRLSGMWIINAPLIAFVEAFRCTPLLVQMIWFYYALPKLAGIEMSKWTTATLVLSCYTAAFYAEIFRGGIVSIEAGQWDAARAIGLSRWNMMRLVILPQAIRRMVPPFMNQSIIQLKNTSLVSVITVPDLLYQGELITADTYKPMQVYTVVALVYFALLLPTTLAVQAYERRSGKRT
jgi:polar amino acid transport system permease protein